MLMNDDLFEFIDQFKDHVNLAQLKEQDDSGNSPLHYLARMKRFENNSDIINLFFEKFPNDKSNLLKIINKDGMTPLHLAIHTGNVNQADNLFHDSCLLLHGEDNGIFFNFLEAIIKSEYSSLFKDIFQASIKKCPQLLTETTKDYPNILLMAMEKQLSDFSSIILENLGEEDSRKILNLPYKGLTPLMLAIKGSLDPLASKILNREELDIRVKGSNDRNILHVAIEEKKLIIAEEILKRTEIKEIINQPDYDGNMPIHLAISNGSFQFVSKLLLQKDVDILSRDKQSMDILRLTMIKDPTMLNVFRYENMEPIYDINILKEFVNSKHDGYSLLTCAIMEKNLRNEHLEKFLSSWTNLILIEDYTEMDKEILQHAVTNKRSLKIFKDVLDYYRCSDDNDCISKGLSKEGTVLEASLKELDSHDFRKISNIILKHKESCGRQRVLDLLSKSYILNPLISGLKEDIFHFLLDWVESGQANLLHVAVQLDQVDLIKAIYKKDSKSQKCRQTGLTEALMLAAQEVRLNALEFLLYKDTENEPGVLLDKMIEKNSELLHMLLHQSAKNDCPEIFKLLVNKISNTDVLKKLDEDEKSNIIHSIGKGKESCFANFELLKEKLKDIGDDALMKEFIHGQDQNGNLPLHIAAIDINNMKLTLIEKLLEYSSDPSAKNNDKNTFLAMSLGVSQMLSTYINTRMKSQNIWLTNLRGNEKQLSQFIELEDDSVLFALLNKLNEIGKIEGSDVHPNKDLIGKVWHKEKVLPKSLSELLRWEAAFHDFNLSDSRKNKKCQSVKQCCKLELDPSISYLVYKRIQDDYVYEESNIGYYIRNSFSAVEFILFLFKFLDLAFDIALCFEYYYFEEFYQDMPQQEECKENFTLACYFYKVERLNLFIVSVAIFLLIVFADAFFVMTCNETSHYKAVLVGKCCWSNVSEKSKNQKMPYWSLITVVNQIAAMFYGCFMKTFMRYWKPSEKKKQTIKATQSMDIEALSECSHCKNCPKDDCVCIFCSNRSDDPLLMTKLAKEASTTVTLSKVVNSATENSWMPIIQLCLLFPHTIHLFPKETVNTSEITEITKGVGSNWRFIVTTASITMSLLSMSVTLTETYFAKPGKHTYKSHINWAIFFMSIILQVVPKIFAFQIFSFGFIAFHFGPGHIIGSLLVIAWISSGTRAVWHYLASRNKSVKSSMLFGLSSLYYLSEHHFYTLENASAPDVDQTDESRTTALLSQEAG